MTVSLEAAKEDAALVAGLDGIFTAEGKTTKWC